MSETMIVDHVHVACDGGGGALGHPKVYLHIDTQESDSIVCPYCSRMFKLNTHTELGSAA